MEFDVALLKPGVRARVKAGAAIYSKNPSRAEVRVQRPYWVLIDHIDHDDNVVWVAHGGYYARTPRASFDSVESY